MLFVFLYFSEFIVLLGAPLNQDYRYQVFLVVTFAMVFLLYLMIFLLKSAGKFSNTSLFVILFTFLGFLIGILNGWYIKDIAGDSLRFLSPFLAYFLGKHLLKKLTLDQIKSTFMIILKVLLYMVTFDLLYRVFGIIILDEPIVKYPGGGVEIPVIMISFFLFSWYHTPIKGNVLFSFFIILLLTLFIISPVMSGSKTRFLSTAFVLLLIPFIFGQYRHKLWTIVFFIFGAFLVVYNQSSILIIDRIMAAIEIVFSTGSVDTNIDLSSYARVMEFRSALDGLLDSEFYPLSFLIGTGSGSLWYSSIDVGSGLNIENFRPDSGVHHIHIELASLVFRHGLIGLSMYLVWIFYVARKSYLVFKYYFRHDIFVASMSAAIVAQLCSVVIVMFSGTSIYGHFFVGLISAIPVVLYNRRHIKT